MKKTWAVMVNEIRTSLGRKAFVIVSLGLPLLVGVIVLVMILLGRDTAPAGPSETGPQRPEATGYVDPAGLIRVLPSDVPDGWLMSYPDEMAAQAALEAGDIQGYYVIPAGYLQSGELSYVQLDYDFISGNALDHARMGWVLLVNLFEGDEAAARAGWAPLDVNWQQTTAAGAAGQDASDQGWISELLPNLMAFLLYMAIILPASTLVSTVTDEKKNRVMEILLSSVSPGQLISGKILALGLLGLLQMSLWVAILWVVAHLGGQALAIPPGFSIPTSLLVWTLVYTLLGYAMYGSQMAGLGALAPDVKDTSGPVMIVLSPLIIVYVFLVIIVRRPDGALAVALSLFPLTSPVAMMARMTATDVPVWQPLLAAVLQLLTAIVIVRAVARLFHAQTLLSGQPFNLKTYSRALLGRT
jgi:ABC-2 type transport system permease protein